MKVFRHVNLLLEVEQVEEVEQLEEVEQVGIQVSLVYMGHLWNPTKLNRYPWVTG